MEQRNRIERIGRLFALVAILAVPASAWAQGEAGDAGGEPADDESCAAGRDRDGAAAMIYGPIGTAAKRAEVEELLACRIDEDEGLPGRVVRLDEIPFPDTEPLWVLGGEQDSTCGTGVVSPDWAKTIDQAREQLDALETAVAQKTIDEALQNLACADSIVERTVLGNLFMVRGLARFYEGGEEAAREDFRRAVTMNTGIEWDDSYPPEPKQVYLKAREDIFLPGKGRVEAVFLPGEVLQVVIDGQSVAAGRPGGLEVAAGEHLLQYMMPDQTLYSRVTTIAGGETRLLVSQAGLESAILVGGSQPDNAPVARSLLHRLSHDWSAQRVYVADLTDGVDGAYVYRFSTDGARFERLEAPVREVAEDGTIQQVEARSSIEGLLVLPNAVAEGSATTVTAESALMDGNERIYLGQYEVLNLARSGVRSTFNLPDKIPAGVYDVRVVDPDGSENIFPRAFSVIGQAKPEPVSTEPRVVIVQNTPEGTPEPDERLRLGFHWGYAYYRGSWATLDLEMDVRLGEGFCLDGGVGTRMSEGYYPHGYWRAGFKVRWYPRVVNGYFTINFQQFFEDLFMGPRAAVGIDIVIPQVKSFYMTLEAGGGVMFEKSREVYGWFHLMGGTGMRF